MSTVARSILLTLSLTVLASMVWQCGCLAQSAPRQTYQQVISYTPIGEGAPAIDVVFNGAVKARMILDSGSSVCAITDKLAAKLGLANGPFVQLPNGPFRIGGNPVPIVMISRIDIAKFYSENTPFVIISSKRMASVGAQVDGIIGANAMTVFPVMFDFQNHQITLYSQSLSASDLKGIGMDDAAVVPVTDHDDDFVFSCPVVLASGDNHAQANLTIDTGSALTVVGPDIVAALKIKPAQPLGPTETFPLYEATLNVLPVVVPDISIGGVDSELLSIYYIADKPTNEFPLPLGLDVLSHYRILLDYAKKVMYIKPAEGNVAPSIPTIHIKAP